MALDAFSSLFQARILNTMERNASQVGFGAFFGKPNSDDRSIYYESSSKAFVEISVQTRSKPARLIKRGSSFSNLDSGIETGEEWSTEEMSFPLIETEGGINASQLQTRIAGEIPLTAWNGRVLSMQERRRELFLRLAMRKSLEVFRTNAILASQAIRTGMHDMISGTTNTNFIYDFNRSPESILNLVGNDRWGQSNGNILDRVNTACEHVLTRGGKLPEVLLLGQDMLSFLINDSRIASMADNRRIELVNISDNNPVPQNLQRLVDAGFTPFGRIRTDKGHQLWMFTFLPFYNDLETGLPTKFLPENEAVIASFSAVCDRHFGPQDKMPPTGIETQWMREVLGFDPSIVPKPLALMRNEEKLRTMIFDPRSIYADVRPNGNNKAYIYRVQSAPIYAPTEIGAYYTIKNT